MKINEITDADNSAWIMKHGKDFRQSFTILKRRHMLLSTDYNESTQNSVALQKMAQASDLLADILEMRRFCKIAYNDTETEEILKSLNLMYSSCKSIIEELNKYL